MLTFPKTTTAKELQKNYRKIFDDVKGSKEPTIVMRNNKPEVAIIDIKWLDEMKTIIDILISRDEASLGKVKTLNGPLSSILKQEPPAAKTLLKMVKKAGMSNIGNLAREHDKYLNDK
jgi:PHD/YefM family antitoxin component YafN of YafNO toxin-antitoxin module